MKKTYIQPEVKEAKAYTDELMGELIIGSDGRTVESDTEEEEEDYNGTFRAEETRMWEDIYYRSNVWQR
jgi:hypothetical protein